MANVPEEEFEEAIEGERPATITQLAERGRQPPHGVDEERPAKLRQVPGEGLRQGAGGGCVPVRPLDSPCSSFTDQRTRPWWRRVFR